MSKNWIICSKTNWRPFLTYRRPSIIYSLVMDLEKIIPDLESEFSRNRGIVEHAHVESEIISGSIFTVRYPGIKEIDIKAIIYYNTSKDKFDRFNYLNHVVRKNIEGWEYFL